jgi:hypothetical protein
MTARKSPRRRAKSKAKRREWWATLTTAEQAAYVEKKLAEKATKPLSGEALEASVRLDLANERGCFMSEIPDADVAERILG